MPLPICLIILLFILINNGPIGPAVSICFSV